MVDEEEFQNSFKPCDDRFHWHKESVDCEIAQHEALWCIFSDFIVFGGHIAYSELTRQLELFVCNELWFDSQYAIYCEAAC